VTRPAEKKKGDGKKGENLPDDCVLTTSTLVVYDRQLGENGKKRKSPDYWLGSKKKGKGEGGQALHLHTFFSFFGVPFVPKRELAEKRKRGKENGNRATRGKGKGREKAMFHNLSL